MNVRQVQRCCTAAHCASKLIDFLLLLDLKLAAKKREMDDNSKKLGQLFWKLNAGELSAELLPQLQQLCLAIDAANWTAASGIQVGTCVEFRTWFLRVGWRVVLVFQSMGKRSSLRG